MPSLGAGDQVFDALANRARRDIIARLSRGRSTTPDLRRAFAISKQGLSRHLRVLEDAGLIERRRRGRVDDLYLVPSPIDELSQWAAMIKDNWSHNFDRLDAVLSAQND